MKYKTVKSNSPSIKKMAELAEQRKKQEMETEENRKRVMSKQLFNVIGNNNIVITKS